MLKALGLMRKAHSEFDAAVAIDPKDPDNLFEKIDFLLQAPVLAGGDRTRALDVANELVKIDPARGYLALARIAWKQKEFGRLEGLYRKAAQSNPQSYEAQMALANLYLGNPVVPEDLDASSRANFHLAEEHARAALDLNPDRIDAYRALVMALVSGRRWDETAKVLARVEAAIPDDLSPYVVAARAMLREGVELTRAESYLKKYSTQTQEPEVGAPLLAGAHWSLALVYQKGGRTADARTELETVLRLKPDFEAARRELERLR